MFRSGQPNAYDDLVVKATDETQTSENWGVLIEICDHVVSDKSASGPRDCIASLQKRLQHRSANVQLYCMTLAEALVKNCGEKVHKEVASRSFMNALAAIVQGRNTHDKVKKRVLQCLKSWREDFKGNANLGLVEETEQDLASKGELFTPARRTSPYVAGSQAIGTKRSPNPRLIRCVPPAAILQRNVADS